MKMLCWKCEREMKRVKDNFHGFTLPAWKCPGCKEIIYDGRDIQPILEYLKMKAKKGGITATVGVLGRSKIVRIPKVAEEIYKIRKGDRLKLDLGPEGICIRVKA